MKKGELAMLKKIFLTLMMTVSLCILGGLNHQAEAYWGMVVNCNEWITLRSYPSTEAASLDRIPLGEWVWIHRGYHNNGFYSAEYNGQHGYVLAAYIKYVTE